MNKKKNIAVFTSTRAEYGLLSPILRELKNSPEFNLILIVSGSHLSEQFGNTVDIIREDGFEIVGELEFINEAKKSNLKEAKSIAILADKFVSFIDEHPIDLLMVLGDRFELLPIASIALVSNVPITHISGGDVTEGAIDNQVRHALTKMSHLHFPATEEYKRNLLKMGEEEWRVTVAGEPGLDLLRTFKPIDKKELFRDLEIDVNSKLILATFHPETIDNTITPQFVEDCLNEILNQTQYSVLVTGANFDNGGLEINEKLRSISVNNKRIHFVDSLGQKRYYSILNYVSLVIGNSSSGLTEVQSFKIPVINIGKRQQGRLSNDNVMHVDADVSLIMDAIKIATTKENMEKIKELKNIYGDGHATRRIISKLKSLDWDNLLLKKSVF